MSWFSKDAGRGASGRPAARARAWARAGLAAALLLWAGPAAASRLGPPPPPAPARVVTLAPSLTELVLDLDLGGRLVGVSRFDDAQAVRELPRVGGIVDPSAEKILRLRPDLLLVPPGAGDRATVERLAALGVPVLVVPLKSLPEILEGIVAVADALGARERGEALRAGLEKKIETFRETSEKLEAVRTLIVFDWQPLVVAGPGSYADELLRLAGGENAAGELKGPFPVVPAEHALGLRPARVIDATFGYVPRAILPGWEARVVEARAQALARPGPRLLEALEDLSRLLHPARDEETAP